LSTARITVQAHPGAKRNQVVRFEEGVWHIRVAAPPAEGKANKALFEFLSEVLDVPKSRIWIEKGATSHRKVVGVEGVSQDRVQGRLRASSES
jgi:hypothetical protein